MRIPEAKLHREKLFETRDDELNRAYNTRIFRSIRDCDPLNFKLIDPNRDNRKFDA